jgi:phosphatidylglycerophosphate synthase
MIAIRWQLPESPLRASVALAQCAGLVLLVGTAWAIRSRLHLSAAYPVAAGAFFVGVMAIAIGFLNATHPFSRFGAGNQITTIRLLLVALVASLVFERTSRDTALVAVAASGLVTALDGVDGWLARQRGMASAFGARFDMEIDALLIMTLSVLAYRSDKAGVWVLASGLLRYIFVAAGWMFERMRTPLPPSRRRQTVCVAQVIGLICVVAPGVERPFSAFLAAASLLLLLSSFLADTLWLTRHSR